MKKTAQTKMCAVCPGRVNAVGQEYDIQAGCRRYKDMGTSEAIMSKTVLIKKLTGVAEVSACQMEAEAAVFVHARRVVLDRGIKDAAREPDISFQCSVSGEHLRETDAVI